MAAPGRRPHLVHLRSICRSSRNRRHRGTTSRRPSAPSPDKPGLMHDIGKLFEKSLSVLPPLKAPGEAMDDLNTRARRRKESAKDAGDALSRLVKPSSMVSGRTICPAAANGTPDCKAAADKLCQSKGYRDGKSLSADSAETCSAKVLHPRTTAQTRRLPDRQLCDDRALSIAVERLRFFRLADFGVRSGACPQVAWRAKREPVLRGGRSHVCASCHPGSRRSLP